MISVEAMAVKVGRALLKRRKATAYWKALAEKRALRIEALLKKLGKVRAEERAAKKTLRDFRRRQMKLPLVPSPPSPAVSLTGWTLPAASARIEDIRDPYDRF